MLRAGAAEVVITPPVGTLLEGYGARTEPSIGVHDDLTAQALVLDDGRTRVGLLTCDLIGVDRHLTARVRQEVERRGLLPGDHLLSPPPTPMAVLVAFSPSGARPMRLR